MKELLEALVPDLHHLVVGRAVELVAGFDFGLVGLVVEMTVGRAVISDLETETGFALGLATVFGFVVGWAVVGQSEGFHLAGLAELALNQFAIPAWL